MRKIDKIIIHCSDSETGNAVEINWWHENNGWDCIGYHFVILNGHEMEILDGVIEPGRKLAHVGAHAKGYNKHSVGICLVGKDYFTVHQMAAAKKLCLELMETFGLKPADIIGHYEVNNKKTCPNIDMDNFRSMFRR